MNRRDFIKSAIIGAAGVSVPLGVSYQPIVVEATASVPDFPRKVLKIFTENGLETFPVTGNTLTVPRRIVEAIYSGSQHWMEEIIITDQTPQITIA